MKVMRIICIVVVCLWALPAFAQDKPTDTMEIVRDAMNSDKRAFIALNMDLTEAEGEKFWPVYDKYQEALRDLNEDYVLFVWANMEDTLISSNDKAQTIIKEFLDIETMRIELIKTFAGQFGEVLPPRKLIRYLQLESRAKTFINNMVEKRIPLLE